MIPWLRPESAPDAFPPVTQALKEPDGLLCAGGDLRPERLLAAYRRGIFPWFSAGQPILWWSPDPRMVLFPDELKVSRSLRKTLRQPRFRVTIDTCFDTVIAQCADSGTRAKAGTWISPAMRTAYAELHRLEYAHSVEVWLEDRRTRRQRRAWSVACMACCSARSSLANRCSARPRTRARWRCTRWCNGCRSAESVSSTARSRASTCSRSERDSFRAPNSSRYWIRRSLHPRPSRQRTGLDRRDGVAPVPAGSPLL